jgi:type I restriction enzyme S subunit
MSWETLQLGEFLTLKRGYDLPSSQRKEGDVPIVSSSGITGRHNVARVEGPGVVTGRYGTLGKVFFVNEDYWPLNTALYVKDFKGNDRRFSAYFLKSVLARTTSDKAAVPGVNRNDLHARKVTVTRDIGLQSAIASILSAYDDLIENNRRRIQLLEQAARLLYKEWFVHLRFPGHEHVTIIDRRENHTGSRKVIQEQ